MSLEDAKTYILSGLPFYLVGRPEDFQDILPYRQAYQDERNLLFLLASLLYLGVIVTTEYTAQARLEALSDYPDAQIYTVRWIDYTPLLDI